MELQIIRILTMEKKTETTQANYAIFIKADQLFAGHEMKSMEYCKHIVQSTIFGGN